MAKIIFLGSAGKSSVMVKGQRLAGGIIIQFEGIQFHLNPGPGALISCGKYGINPRHSTVFLASSNELMKTGDLNLMVDIMTFSGIEKRGLLIGSASVVSGNDINDASLSVRCRDLLEKLIVLSPGNKVGVSLCEVHPVRVDSNDKLAIGFKLFFPKFCFGYVGQTTYSEELVEDLAGSDILVLDVLNEKNEEGEVKILDAELAEKVIGKVKPKLAIINGFGLGLLKADPLVICREIGIKTGVQVIAAKDGLILNTDALQDRNPVRGY